MCFVKILFHLPEVAVGIDFMREKNLFLTRFAHCKVALWKSCELDLLLESLVNRRVEGWKPATQMRLKVGCINTENQHCIGIL
jgi:hypothetical protein